MAEENENRKKINPIIIILIAVIALMAVILIVRGGKSSEPRNDEGLRAENGIKTEPNVFMSDEEAEEHQKDKVPSIRISMYNTIRCYRDDDGNLRARVGVTNKNDHQIVVQFTLAETEEVLYMTGLIPPGGELEEIPVQVDLKAGTYSVNAIYSAISEEDNETDLGSTGINVDMIID